MNIKTYLIITAACLPLALRAQTIDFETTDGYTAIGVYDTWEASPFRTGKLEGNAAVIPNPFREASPQATAPANPTTKVLAVQRSRFGSNTFGARIDLTHPRSAIRPRLSPQTRRRACHAHRLGQTR